MELHATARLFADAEPTDTKASIAVEAAHWPPGFAFYARHKDTKYIVAGFVNHNEAEAFCKAMTHGQYKVCDSSIARSRYEFENGE